MDADLSWMENNVMDFEALLRDSMGPGSDVDDRFNIETTNVTPAIPLERDDPVMGIPLSVTTVNTDNTVFTTDDSVSPVDSLPPSPASTQQVPAVKLDDLEQLLASFEQFNDNGGDTLTPEKAMEDLVMCKEEPEDEHNVQDAFDCDFSTSNALIPGTDITEYELVTITVPELNKRLRGCPNSLARQLKAKRRTLKNRGYAQNCRIKRRKQQNELQGNNLTLQQQLEKMQQELAKTRQERDYYKNECNRLRNPNSPSSSIGSP